MKTLTLLKFSIIAAIAITGLQGCDDKTLTPLETIRDTKLGYVSAEASFCTQPSKEYRQKIKYVIVVDRSTSNSDISDPTGIRRYA